MLILVCVLLVQLVAGLTPIFVSKQPKLQEAQQPILHRAENVLFEMQQNKNVHKKSSVCEFLFLISYVQKYCNDIVVLYVLFKMC